MTQAAPQTRQELEAGIIRKAWEDEAFRAALIADPAAALAGHTGVPGIGQLNITVHQEAAGEWNIVLPARPADPGELSEAELAQVAGGATDPLELAARRERMELAQKQLGFLFPIFYPHHLMMTGS